MPAVALGVVVLLCFVRLFSALVLLRLNQASIVISLSFVKYASNVLLPGLWFAREWGGGSY